MSSDFHVLVSVLFFAGIVAVSDVILPLTHHSCVRWIS
jgi:hypothetical protein